MYKKVLAHFKIIAFIGLLLGLPSFVAATNTTTSGHTNLSAISIANPLLDSITVRSQDTLYVNTTGTAQKCRTIIGTGVIQWLPGKSLSIQQLAVNGKMFMVENDTLTFDTLGANTSCLTFAGTTFSVVGKEGKRAVLQGAPGGGTALPYISFNYASGTFSIDFAEIRRFRQSTSLNFGLIIQGSSNGNRTITNSLIDSCGIRIYQSKNVLFDKDTIRQYKGCGYNSVAGNNFTLRRTYHTYNNAVSGDATIMWEVSGDSAWFDSCSIISLPSTLGHAGYGITMTDGGGKWARITNNTITNQTFCINSIQNNPFVTIDNNRISGGTQVGTHECIINHSNDSNWTISRNIITQGPTSGRSAITFYPSTSAPNNLSILYNTINANWGGSAAQAAFSAIVFEVTSATPVTYNNVKMVGNLLLANNTNALAGPSAEICIGVDAGENVTVNFTEFKKNAYEKTFISKAGAGTGVGVFNYPYSAVDSNMTNTTVFYFRDSLAGDFRIRPYSIARWAAESTYFVGLWGAAYANNTPASIGADQILSKRRFPHVQLSARANATNTGAEKFLGRKYDLLVDPSAAAADSAVVQNTDIKLIAKTWLSSLYKPGTTIGGIAVGDSDSIMLKNFCDSMTTLGYTGYVPDSFIVLNTSGSPVIISSDDSLSFVDTTLASKKLQFHGAASARYTFNYKNANLWKYFWYRYRHILANKNKSQYVGILEEEISCLNVGADVASGGGYRLNSRMFPFAPTLLHDYIQGSPSSLGWSPYGVSAADAQLIADSIIKLKHTWIGRLADSIAKNRGLWFANPEHYFYLTDSSNALEGGTSRFTPNDFEQDIYKGTYRARNMSLGKNIGLGLGNTTNHLRYLHYIVNLTDSSAKSVVWTQYTTADTVNTGSLDRVKYERYCYYLMMNDPALVWYQPGVSSTGPSCSQTDPIIDYYACDTIYKYPGPFDTVNIGYPTWSVTNKRHYYVTQSGTDPVGQSYKIYRRDYSNAVVLWRQKTGSVYDNTSIVTYNLGNNYRLVGYTGGLGASGSVASIRNGEGQIWVGPNIESSKPASLTGLIVDSIKSDYGAAIIETDSTRITITTGAQTWPDSVITLYSTTGYRTDSTSTSSAFRQAYTSSTTTPINVLVNGTETYTLYVSSWVMDADSGWSVVTRASRVFQGVIPPNPPAPLTNLTIDTVKNDFTGETDTIRINQQTGAQAFPDSIITVWSTTAYPTDSMNVTNSIRRLYSPSATLSNYILLTTTETYTLYVTSWVFDIDSGWSTRKQASRTYTYVAPPAGPSAFPSPRSKQLRVAVLAYYAPWMRQYNFGGYYPELRKWAADRYNVVLGSPIQEDQAGFQPPINVAVTVDSMHYWNPNLKFTSYDLYAREGGSVDDSASIMAFCALNSITPDSVMLMTGPNASDSITTVGSDAGAEGIQYTTPGGNKFIRKYLYANDAVHLRYIGNTRSKWYGRYLWYKFKQHMTANHLDGLLIDEETRLTGLFPNDGGYSPVSSSDWLSSLTTISVPFTGINISAMPDSQNRWREIWVKELRDSARANGKILLPNFALYHLHPNQTPMDSGWKVEGKRALSLYGGAVYGEGYNYVGGYFNGITQPGGSFNSRNDYWKRMPGLARQVRDSNVDLMFGWITQGPNEWTCPAGGITKARDKMMFLGLFLQCTWPGSARVYMFPMWITKSDNSFYHNRNVTTNFSCTSMTYGSDTLYCWSDAWGKYWGVPDTLWDTTQTGTSNGQAYRVYKKYFTRPGAPSDTLTFAATRYGEGTDYSASATITLPGTGAKNWYQLIENTDDSAGKGASVQAFWNPTPLTGGATFTMLPFETKVFSSDTVLSNTGPTQINPPAALSSSSVDSIKNDYSGETDSIRLIRTTGAQAWPDSVITLYSTTGYRTDSTSTTNAIRRAYAQSTALTDYITLAGNETYTLYMKSWVKDVDSGWSQGSQVARTFTYIAPQPPLPPVSAIVDSLHNDYTGEDDSVRIRVTTSLEAWPDSLIIVWNSSGQPTDSLDVARSIRRAYTSNTTFTDTVTVTAFKTESYTFYVAVWAWDAVTGWSVATRGSRYFEVTAINPTRKVVLQLGGKEQ